MGGAFVHKCDSPGTSRPWPRTPDPGRDLHSDVGVRLPAASDNTSASPTFVTYNQHPHHGDSAASQRLSGGRASGRGALPACTSARRSRESPAGRARAARLLENQRTGVGAQARTASVQATGRGVTKGASRLRRVTDGSVKRLPALPGPPAPPVSIRESQGSVCRWFGSRACCPFGVVSPNDPVPALGSHLEPRARTP